ncbi:hypothetical protein MP228_000331 [Amoeboaphelidium protococcarum]|nr:hypothetical protein MP228_000331 [Amoeboaphelidium protococcarum]
MADVKDEKPIVQRESAPVDELKPLQSGGGGDGGEFSVPIEELQKMFDPKNLDHLHSLGGVSGLIKALKSNPQTGLYKDGDYSSRKEFYGANRLPEQRQLNIFELVWIALHDKTLILLCVAAFVSLVVGVYIDLSATTKDKDPHWVEGVAIIIAVIIVVLVQSINDYQKESQFRKLNAKKEDRQVKCLRSGNVQLLSIYDIVVGDVLLLEPGDVVNVDGILISGHNLKADESSATGESDMIRKTPYTEGAVDIDPFVLSGGKITEGVGQFLVTCVGEHSFNGKLMMGLRVPTEDTPLQVKLDSLAESIAKLGASISILLLIILLVKYCVQESLDGFPEGAIVFESIINIVIQAIVIIVVAVPEGLPLAVTIALAYGTSRMMKDNNMVRVLSACETMGNATTVCSDKTGTLTQNRMTVVAGFIGCKTEFKNDSGIAKLKKKLNEKEEDVLDTKYRQVQSQSFSGPQYVNLLIDSVVMNSTAFEEVDQKGAKSFVGNKTESALLEFCAKIGLHDYTTYKKAAESSVLQVYPFSSERKSMSTLIKVNDDTVRFYVKGASEIVLKYSDQVMAFEDQSSNSYKVIPLTDALRNQIQGKISNFADESLRTIVVSFKDIPMSEYVEIVGADNIGKEVPAEAAEKLEKMCQRNLAVVLLVGIEDPLRDGVPEAVKRCQTAGVFVRMVTGDNVNTAKAIATKCGIYTKGGIVMEGPKFRRLSNEDMEAIIPRLQVLARSSPGDKQILVGKLKEMGETVAVTGDGTNDAPALKMADVGFSMGITGTEVSKEASAIILMDDNFTSIVKAMMWGRSVNDSVKKFLQFQLTVNISAVTIAFVSAVASSDNKSVLTAVQLLWVNLIMDSLAALSLATDSPDLSILNRMPDSKKDPLISVEMWKMILGQAAFQIFANLFSLYVGPTIFRLDVSQPDQAKLLNSFVFNLFIFLQLFNQVNCRTIDGSLNVFKGITKNRFILPMSVIIVGVQVIIMFFGGSVFKTVPITGGMWAASVLVGLLVLPLGVVVRLLPTGNGCVVCGVPIGLRDESRLVMTRERLQWQHAIGSVRTQLHVFKALRGTARHSINSSGSIETDSISSGHRSHGGSPHSGKRGIPMQNIVSQAMNAADKDQAPGSEQKKRNTIPAIGSVDQISAITEEQTSTQSASNKNEVLQ